MKLLTETRDKIKKILVSLETGKISDYSSVYIYEDGKGDVPQVTLSVGFTQDYNLKQVIVDYCKNPKVLLGEKLKPYVHNIKNPLLYKDTYFLGLLRAAGSDPIMQEVQDAHFKYRYLIPAETFADSQGFELPLSYAVIADSYLHSGRVPMEIRIEFGERTPLNGGDEKAWVKAYLVERRKWLATRKRESVKKTIYRPNCFLEAIAKNNWSLLAPVNANGNVIR